MSPSMRTGLRRCVELPEAATYTLQNANVPQACLDQATGQAMEPDIDSLITVVHL